MKKLMVIALELIMGFSLSVYAQQINAPSGLTFKSGWYFGANVGVNTFSDEGGSLINSNNPHYFSLINNSSYLGHAELGYRFTPVIGIRGFFGYIHTNWPYTRLVQNTDGSYPVARFGAENLTVDLLVNLSNWWIGYNPNRKIDISAFVGGGAAYLNKNVLTSKIATIGRGGLQADYHLTPVLDLNLIAEGNIAQDNYNDHIINPPSVDLFSALTVGFTYHIPEVAKKITTISEVAKTNLVEKLIEVANAKPKSVVLLDTTKTVIEEPLSNPVVKNALAASALDQKVFFTIGNSTIGNSKPEDAIDNIVKYMKTHPTATITVSGYADKLTGSVAQNNLMSKLRAVNVANNLIRNYDISIKRIRLRWYGSGIQPYSIPDKNRLVIVKSPKTNAVPEPVSETIPAKTTNPVKPVSVIVADNATKTTIDIPSTIFEVINFLDNNAEIVNTKQEATIQKVVEYLKAYSDAKILVSGYADKSYGSKDVNNLLSKKRALTVANTLITKYSISSDRIQTKWFGGSKQPDATASMNRLVLIETIR